MDRTSHLSPGLCRFASEGRTARLANIACLTLLVAGAAAALQPAHAVCSIPHAITSGYSYVYTPACGYNMCGSTPTSVTDDFVGTFWSVSEGDPTFGVGIDNGAFPALGGWIYTYPNYASSISSSWDAYAGIDGCIDDANPAINPDQCMSVLLADRDPNSGIGAFSLLTDKPDGQGAYNFQQAMGGVNLVPLPGLSITDTVPTGDGSGFEVTVNGISVADIEAGLYLDPACPSAGGGGVSGLIQGYRVFAQEVPLGQVPADNLAGNWTAVGPVVPLGDPSVAALTCSSAAHYFLAPGLVFDSDFETAWLGENSGPFTCGCVPEEEICDGADNDCDGTVDNIPNDGAPCPTGLPGICNVGALQCVDGTEVCGTLNFPGDFEEVCDGFDNDCDGTTDNDPVDSGVACTAGVGECSAEGLSSCNAGVLECDAVPGAPSAEICDGLDNDCDGIVDDNPTDAGGACSGGVGQCANSGVEVCVAGVLECATPSIVFADTASNEILVARRDGTGTPVVLHAPAVSFAQGPVQIEAVPSTNELYIAGGNSQEVRVGNLDGTGMTTVLGHSAGLNAMIHGVAVDLSGGRLFFSSANNFDPNLAQLWVGNLDGTGAATPLFVGLTGGVHGINYDAATDDLYFTEPNNNRISTANADGSGVPTVLFDEADGVVGPRGISVDFVNGWIYWAEQVLGVKRGRIDGTGTPESLFVPTPDYLLHSLEVDIATQQVYWTEFDFNLRSRVRVGNADGSGSPTDLFDLDQARLRGIDLSLFVYVPTAEVCDGVDNDCDGTVDNEPVDTGAGCTVGIGECVAGGIEFCDAGVLVCDAVPGAPIDEVCDGLDNDCNGVVDNDPTDAGAPCTAGVGECATGGFEVCRFGVLGCDALAGPSLVFANTTANEILIANRDGTGVPSTLHAPAVSRSRGPIQIEAVPSTNKLYIAGGQASEARVGNLDGTGATTVLDNTTGFGEVQGVAVDLGGGRLFFATSFHGATSDARIFVGNLDGSGAATPLFSGLTGRVHAINYDASTDDLYFTEPDDNRISTANADGTGAPAALFDATDGVSGPRGISVDFANGWIYWAEPFGDVRRGRIDGTGAPESLFAPTPGYRAHSLEVDAATQQLYWTEFHNVGNGSSRVMVGNADGSGTPTVLYDLNGGALRGIDFGLPGSEPSAEICDGLDNDCDGTTDNSLTDVGDACTDGIGECLAAGVEICSGASLVCDAIAGDPADEICDGLDNDCDGTTDNNLTDAGGACTDGLGECMAAGFEICSGGSLVCDAIAGDPADEICDGLDNDCDGMTDEGCDGEVKFETRTVLGVGANWMTVELSNAYASPVIVCTPQFLDNQQPVLSRITNVTSTSFDLRLQTAGDLFPVAPESTWCIIVEEGAHTIDGVKIEGQTYLSEVTDSKNNWSGTPQTYLQAYMKPVVLAQVMSFNDPRWSAAWVAGKNRAVGPDSTNIVTGKMVGEDPDTTRESETVAFIVFEEGHGTLGGIEFEAAVSDRLVGGLIPNAPFEVFYNTAFPAPPGVPVATQAGMVGGDGGWVQTFANSLPTTADTIKLFIAEDLIGDDEQGHATERVAYVVFAEDVVVPVPGVSSALRLETFDLIVDGTFQSVATTHTYASPVVVCNVEYSNNNTPVVTRLDNVGPGGFDVKLQNPSDGPVAAESVNCMVIEEGTWEEDGVKFEARKFDATNTDRKGSWAGVLQTYNQTYDSPAIVGQVMSYNDPDFSVYWQSRVSRYAPPTSTQLRNGKTVLEDSDITRDVETVGFVVFESGQGPFMGSTYAAATGTDTILGTTNGAPFPYTFPVPFASAPSFALTSMAGVAGGDGGWSQRHAASSSLTETTIQLSIDEDQISDAERSHTSEHVAYLVFGDLIAYPPIDECEFDEDCPGFFDFCDGETTCIDGRCDTGPVPCAPDETCDEATDTCNAPVFRMETLVIPNVSDFNDSDTYVPFQNRYERPVVVCTPVYAENTLPIVPRVWDVSSNGFQVALQNPSNSPVAITDTVNCLVVEEGSWMVDGNPVEAQRYTATDPDNDPNWVGTAQTLTHPFANPVIAGQVTTANDSRWSAYWQQGQVLTNPPTNGFLRNGYTVMEDPDTTRAPEEISFIVFEEGTGTIGGVAFEAFLTGDFVRYVTLGTPYTHVLSLPFTPTVGVVSVAGIDGPDGAFPYFFGPNPFGPMSVDLTLDEDQTLDGERIHTNEQVMGIVFESDVVIGPAPIADALPGVCYGSLGFGGSGEIITIDPLTGLGSAVGPSGLDRVQGLAINSAGEMFSTDSASNLYRIDAETGAAFLVGPTGVPFIEGIAFDENDVLYGVDTGELFGLHTIDSATAATTFIGPTGTPLAGLAFDPTDGTLFGSASGAGVGGVPDGIFTVDKTSGAASLVGTTGTGLGAVPDIHFIDGQLYGVQKIGGSGPDAQGGLSALLAIDKTTGAGTIIGTDTGFPSVSGLAVRPPFCGDGLVNGNEECDPTAPDPGDCEDDCTFPCPTVTLDKQVSCDAGLTWSDSCTGWDDPNDPNNPYQPEVLVRYVASTVGAVDLLDCELVDSNGAVLAAPIPIGSLPGGLSDVVIWQTGLLACSEELEAGEPNTASLTCTCPNTDPTELAIAQDTADIECQLPSLTIEKTCDPQDVVTGLSAVHLTVTNPPNPRGASMINCSIQERLIVSGPDIPVPFNSNLFDLAPGQSIEFDFDLDMPGLGVAGDGLNAASVICQIAGAPGKIFVAGATDVCEACEASVDKQVSCDGGVTWEDGCLSSDDVKVRYLADVPGAGPLFNCVLTDSNGLVLPAPVDVGMIPGASSGTVIFETDLLACSDDLVLGEPDTATLSCECYEDGSGQVQTVEDTAEIECTNCGNGIVEDGETCEPSAGSGELVVDGGFEAGPLTGTWVETSTNFGQAVYGDFPFEGNFHVWIGGSGGAFEEAGVAQMVTLPTGPSAVLSFYLRLATCSGDTADFFEIRAGGDLVFSIDMTDVRCSAGTYAHETVDLTAYVGQTIELSIFGSTANNGVDSNIFVDNVSLEIPAVENCRDDCTFCGDAITNGDESCDDGNDIDDDGCRTDCTFCGDTIVDTQNGETCDPPSGGSGELIVDGGFETGPNAGAWVENTTNFSTSIYTQAAFEGTFGVWIGGSGGVFEEGGVEQDVSLPPGLIADLKFDLNFDACSEVDGDFFEVLVDGDQVFFSPMSGERCGAGFQQVVIDLSSYVGQTVNIEFHGVTATTGVDSNIFMDNVTLEVLQADTNCREDCTFCGDGEINGDEECDFADPSANPNCNDECTIDRFCGDGDVTPELGETCDPPGDPAGASGNECRGDCTVCGDGVVDAGEFCDDGNNLDDDACRNDCTACGDGFIDSIHSETCDPPGETAGTNNLVQDGSFELGTPNPFWTEFSTNFGTTLCSPERCGFDFAVDGDWWSWFGQTGGPFDEGIVSQPIDVPDGATASLSFALWLITCSGETTDFFQVKVNDDVVFFADLTDPLCDAGGYTLITLDLSAYAGQSITLEFQGVTGTADTGGNIFLDLVDLRVFQDATCRDDCTFCGDGSVDPGEDCDPADLSGPACSEECTIVFQAKLDGLYTTASTADPVTVNFYNPPYDDAVVVCTIHYNNSSIPLVPRVFNVTSSGFDLILQNPGDLDDTVFTERVDCLVAEAGSWIINGYPVEAQKYTSTSPDDSASWVGFAQTLVYPFVSPVIVGQVMSLNDPLWSVYWQQGGVRADPPAAGLLTNGNTVMGDSVTARADELIGFIVFEEGAGSFDGVSYEAFKTADNIRGVVDSPPYTHTLSSLTTPLLAVASVAGLDGADGAWAYLYGSSPFGVMTLDLALDEDQIGDGERSHTTENVMGIAFSGPFSYAGCGAGCETAVPSGASGGPGEPGRQE